MASPNNAKSKQRPAAAGEYVESVVDEQPATQSDGIDDEVAKKLGLTRAEMEAARARFTNVNLDEVTDETIPVKYWHYTLVERTDEATGEVWHERVRAGVRTVNLIKDIPSEIAYKFYSLEGDLDGIRNMDPAAFAKMRGLVWEAWKFTAPDIPFDDIALLPMDKLIALVTRFFT